MLNGLNHTIKSKAAASGSPFLRLLAFSLPHKMRFIAAMSLLIVAISTEMAIPWLVKIILDDVIVPQTFDWSHLGLLCGAVMLFYVVSAAFQYAQSVMFRHGALLVVNDVRRQLYTHLLKLPISLFDRVPAGKMVSYVTNDTESLRDMFVTTMPTILQGTVRIVAIFIAIALLDWRLMLLSLFLIPILLLTMHWYRTLSMPIFDGVRQQVSNINNTINESLQGMALIQAFGQERAFGKKFEKDNEAWLAYRNRSIAIDSLMLAPFTRLIGTLTAIGIIAWFGVSSWGSVVAVGTLYAFLNYIERFFEPFRQLSMELRKLQVATVSAKRVFELLDEPLSHEAKAGDGKVTGDQATDDKAIDDQAVDDQAVDDKAVEDKTPAAPDHSAEVQASHPEAITFDGVSFSYDGKHNALSNVSFTAESGKFTAIVGHSGSGKSSVINLLMRFYQHQQGAITIGGKNIASLPDAQLRKLVGLVSQEPYIFSGSVLENIDLSHQQTQREAAIHAAEQTGAAQFIERLEDGYDHQPGYSGSSLSLGQRQLIAMARVLAHNPAIFLLDEATANIDSETEDTVKAALANMQQAKTVIAVAHRLSTVMNADKILVMHQGEIVQSGTHDELLITAGHYRDLYLAQKAEEDNQDENIDLGLAPASVTV
ncbi:ABC transporter ATP-binding protein [Photobacterium sanguinicancri]|uniref:ABC transporter ATP-binding protein n=1 Tax=Photobacterium sanguinicancri TaxID=875932 RepID=A0AAW7YD46_9GAMM|nr:ABC transporter ATP-binding protein [Photobacterium sanguinicancri]MDO6544669.1 ABC transporter ATP-binding protein [Photobacterium sanguinicancri]